LYQKFKLALPEHLTRIWISFSDTTPAVAGPSRQSPPSPQPGPSHEADDEDVVEGVQEETENFNMKMAHVLEMLPDADPDYLRDEVIKFENNEDLFMAFVNNAVESHNYPKRDAYDKRKAIEKTIKSFTSGMSVTEFLKHFPNPEAHFEGKTDGIKDIVYQGHCLAFLKERFPRIHVKTIIHIFRKTYNLTKAVSALEREPAKL
jgi:hypothetical protein